MNELGTDPNLSHFVRVSGIRRSVEEKMNKVSEKTMGGALDAMGGRGWIKPEIWATEGQYPCSLPRAAASVPKYLRGDKHGVGPLLGPVGSHRQAGRQASK